MEAAYMKEGTLIKTDNTTEISSKGNICNYELVHLYLHEMVDHEKCDKPAITSK